MTTPEYTQLPLFPPEPPPKRCSVCKQEFPATPEYFTRTNSTRDGLHTQCKSCRQRKNRKWWAENAQRINEQLRVQYASSPEKRADNRNRSKQWRQENREYDLQKKKEYYYEHRADNSVKCRAWRLAHPEYRREHDREYSKRNRERIKARQKEWEQKNKPRLLIQRRPKMRLAQHLRRTRKQGLPTTFTVADWQRALDYFNGCCAVCGRPSGLWHILAQDHWIALSDPSCPGTIPTNMLPLCHGRKGIPEGEPTCNLSKNNKDPQQWLIQRFGEEKTQEILARIEAYFAWLRSLEDVL